MWAELDQHLWGWREKSHASDSAEVEAIGLGSCVCVCVLDGERKSDFEIVSLNELKG